MSTIGPKNNFNANASRFNAASPTAPKPFSSQADKNRQNAQNGENAPQQERDADQDTYLTEAAADLAKGAAGHEAELSASTRVTRQALNPASYDVAHLGPHGFLSTQNMGVGNAEGSLTTDRTGLFGRGNLVVGDTALSTAAGVLANTAYGEFTVQTSAHDRITAGVINGAGVHGAGLTFTQKADGGALNEGFFAIGNASLSVKVLDLDQGKAQLEFQDAKFAGLQFTLGASTGAVGGGLRLLGTYAKSYSLKRWLPIEEANKAIGKQNLFKQKLRSLGLIQAPFVRPNLKDPLNERSQGQQAPNRLLVDDEVSFTRLGTLTGGIAGAFGGVYVGAHGSWTAEFKTTVQKLAPSKVRVTVSPTSNKTLTGGLSIDLPLLASATVLVTRSTARYAAYDFDLTKPEAMQAYHDILELKVPSAMVQIGPHMLADPQQTMKNLTDASDLIPGVEVVALMYGSLPAELSLSGGLTGLKNIFGDAVGMMGFKMSAGKSTVMLASQSSVVQRNEARHEVRLGSLRPGEKKISSKLVEQTLEVAQNDSATSLRQLSLEAEILFERPGKKTRKELIKWLNENFLMMPIAANKAMTPLSKKYGYGVKVIRQLSDSDLEKLWRLKALQGHAYSEQVFASAFSADMPFEGGVRDAFIQNLKNRIVSGGPKEIARLHQFLGRKDQDLKIKVIYEALGKIDEKVNTAKVKYYKRIGANDKSRTIVKRIDTTKKLIDKLENVSEFIESDPLLSRYSTRTIEDRQKDIEQTMKQDVLPIAGMTEMKNNTAAQVLAKLKKKDRDKFAKIYDKLDMDGEVKK